MEEGRKLHSSGCAAHNDIIEIVYMYTARWNFSTKCTAAIMLRNSAI